MDLAVDVDVTIAGYRIRAITILGALETMGLVETWIESRGRAGRVKQIETPFDPQWVREAQAEYIAVDLPVHGGGEEGS